MTGQPRLRGQTGFGVINRKIAKQLQREQEHVALFNIT